ncbi:MAG: hypothetical protein ACLT76_10805 [Clostridium fessum]
MSIENGWYFFGLTRIAGNMRVCILQCGSRLRASINQQTEHRRCRFPDQQPPDSQQHRDRNPVRAADMDDQQDGENADALLDHL